MIIVGFISCHFCNKFQILDWPKKSPAASLGVSELTTVSLALSFAHFVKRWLKFTRLLDIFIRSGCLATFRFRDNGPLPAFCGLSCGIPDLGLLQRAAVWEKTKDTALIVVGRALSSRSRQRWQCLQFPQSELIYILSWEWTRDPTLMNSIESALRRTIFTSWKSIGSMAQGLTRRATDRDIKVSSLTDHTEVCQQIAKQTL